MRTKKIKSTVNTPRPCPSCGNPTPQDPKECPWCASLKCEKCDMGDDVECLSCEREDDEKDD